MNESLLLLGKGNKENRIATYVEFLDWLGKQQLTTVTPTSSQGSGPNTTRVRRRLKIEFKNLTGSLYGSTYKACFTSGHASRIIQHSVPPNIYQNGKNGQIEYGFECVSLNQKGPIAALTRNEYTSVGGANYGDQWYSIVDRVYYWDFDALEAFEYNPYLDTEPVIIVPA